MGYKEQQVKYREFIAGFKRVHNGRTTINYVRMYEKTAATTFIPIERMYNYGCYVADIVNASFRITPLMVQKMCREEIYLSIIRNECGHRIEYGDFVKHADTHTLEMALELAHENGSVPTAQDVFRTYCECHKTMFGKEFFMETMVTG